MKCYEFGASHLPVLLLLPGTCCHWRRNFGGVIPLLENDFHVVCVSYDGFDETEETLFPDMLTEAERIEAFLCDRFDGRIHAAYGCSLGGSMVSLLVMRRVVHIRHAILGSSDMDQAGPIAASLQAALVSRLIHRMLRTGKIPGFMLRKIEQKPQEERAYYHQMLRLFGAGSTEMAFISRRSVRNQFYSDLVTPIEKGLEVPDTKIHCFFAAKMGEKYLERYRLHFSNPDIRRYDLQHEELLMRFPEKWAEEIRLCCEIERE